MQTTTGSVAPTASALCRALEEAWRKLCLVLPELPRNVLLVPATSGARTLGHFSPSLWRLLPDGGHEVGISPRLFDSPEDALLVVLHEAVHGLLWVRGLQGGCSQNNVYHRKQFRDGCREIGLCCDFEDTRHGWNRTLWPEGGVPHVYKEALHHLTEGLPAAYIRQASLPSGPGKATPLPGRVALVCGCGRRLHAARSVAAQGGILCAFCGTAFEAQTGKEQVFQEDA